MTFQRLTDGLKRVYAYLVVGSALGIRLPWWILSSLLPAQRPRRSWTLRKCLNVKILRYMFSAGNSHFKILNPHPTHRALELGQGIEGVYVDGVPELITGKVKEWAAKANVEAIRLPGYWMHKNGENIIMGQKPDAYEKVAYFFHGGGYVFLSAHPDQPTSNIPRGLLASCPSITRAFAIEYRLSSAAPAAGQFPAALVDALAGYSYLVHAVGFRPAQVVLVGDSAGGNLAQALARYLVEYGGTLPGLPPVPGALVMLSPWVDLSGSCTAPTSSVFANRDSDYLTIDEPYLVDVPRAFVEPFGLGFAFQTPYVSPACRHLEDVSFEGFPSTFVAAGDAEMLLDQIRLFQKRMKETLGEDKVVYFEAKDAFHDYLCMPAAEPEHTETLEAISAFIEAL